MKELYVCYASSNEYAGYTGISLLSLLTNNRDINFGEIFILDYGIKEDNKDKLRGIASGFGQQVTFLNAGAVLEGLREELSLQDFSGSLATYSRAFIGYIMPDYVRYLLYIDSDTVVCGSIQKILDMEMGVAVMAGAIGVNQYPYPNEKPNPELNLVSGNRMYVACGIVYYDLKNWREQDCSRMIADTCKLGLSFPLADQTLINNAIPECLLAALPPEFNYWGHCYRRHREVRELKRGGWHSDETIAQLIANPVIIHFKGLFFRPWFDGCISRKKEEYAKYKAMSPWKDVPQETLKAQIAKQSRRQRFHLRFGLAYELAPYQWLADAVLSVKRAITAIQKLLRH